MLGAAFTLVYAGGQPPFFYFDTPLFLRQLSFAYNSLRSTEPDRQVIVAQGVNNYTGKLYSRDTKISPAKDAQGVGAGSML